MQRIVISSLKRIVDFYPEIYGIIFCRTKRETQDVAELLLKDGYNAEALHGDLSQAQRETVMNKFRQRNIQLLVATDVAARGLDVDSLTHVIIIICRMNWKSILTEVVEPEELENRNFNCNHKS